MNNYDVYQTKIARLWFKDIFYNILQQTGTQIKNNKNMVLSLHAFANNIT